MEYAIYKDFYPEVEKKLNRVAKKCAACGNPFTFSVKGEEVRSEKNEFGIEVYYKFILIEVEGTAKVADWECVAILEMHRTGNIIRRINNNIEIPNRFRNSENVCEHCNTNRFRKNLYLIHNVRTDEWKQVGGSCLKLYTDGLSMEYVAAYMDGITELEENDGVVDFHGEIYYDVEEVLSLTIETIEAVGGYYNASSPVSTKSIVSRLVHRSLDDAIPMINADLADARMDCYLSRKDFYKDDTDEKVKPIIDYYLSLDDNSEFVHNVQIILTEKYVSLKNLGFVCYLPEGYAKYIQKEFEKSKVAEEKSEYFGEVGQRFKDKKIKFVSIISSWETQYGSMRVYKIVLENGSVLVWKTSSCLVLDRNEEFDSISFTIKGFNEYKGQKQVEVTRCKVSVKREEE